MTDIVDDGRTTADDGRTPEHGFTISCGSGELNSACHARGWANRDFHPFPVHCLLVTSIPDSKVQ